MEPEVAIEVGNVVQLLHKDDSIEGPFLIQYVSPEFIELVSQKQRLRLPIIDGVLEAPPGVVSMQVVYTPPRPGYVALIGATQGSIVNVELDDGTVINGIVYAVKNDMLELTVQGKTIFLDFAYRGIDPNWGIKAIRVVKPPTAQPEAQPETQPEETDFEEQEMEPEQGQEQEEDDEGESATPEEDLDAFEKALDEGVLIGDVRGTAQAPELVSVQQDIVKANKIKFIGELGEISQRVAASEQEQRHALSEQVQNLLDSLLAEHPSNPDPRVLQGIQRQINRFRVLYNDHTKIGSNGVALGEKPIETSTHPLATALKDPSFSTYWLLPTSYATKKFYDTVGAEEIGGIDAESVAAVQSQIDAEDTARVDQPPFPKGRLAGVIVASANYLQPYTIAGDDAQQGEEISISKPTEDIIVTEDNNKSYAVADDDLTLISAQTRRVLPTAEYSREVPAPLGETMVGSEPVGPPRKVIRTGFITTGTDGARVAEKLAGGVYERASITHDKTPFIDRHKQIVRVGKEQTDAVEPDAGAVAFNPEREDYNTYLKRISQNAGNLVEVLFWPRANEYSPPNTSIVRQRMVPFGAKINELPFEANLVLRLKVQEAAAEIKSEAARRMAAFQRYSNMRPQAFRRYSLVNHIGDEAVMKDYRLRKTALMLPSLAKILAVDGGKAFYSAIANMPENDILMNNPASDEYSPVSPTEGPATPLKLKALVILGL
jgi:hypothetical protein